MAHRTLSEIFSKSSPRPSIQDLFNESQYKADSVAEFYHELWTSPELRAYYVPPASGPTTRANVANYRPAAEGEFRLRSLYIREWKNLEDYTIRFDVSYAIDVVLGWNGTGKSNLFEALVLIFRDLYDAVERDRLPKTPFAYAISYDVDSRTYEVDWDPHVAGSRKFRATRSDAKGGQKAIKRAELGLPHFVFGYYSGPTNRLADCFIAPQREHYYRLVESEGVDRDSMVRLLEERRFFCAETHHAKYVLLAFFYKEDKEIAAFLKDRLRIVGFQSALFIIRKPRWARKDASAENFWGARGVVRTFLERLRDVAFAPLVLTNTVDEGYRTRREDHYYFYVADVQKLQSLAREYPDARSFFVALESADFSELFSDVLVSVLVQGSEGHQSPIVFREMSEGEQQLLTVLGLLRFTKSAQSLILLDEPDTHLNPHWAVDYLSLLSNVMSDSSAGSEEQRTSQLLLSTHDPLVIANLEKGQVHLLKRNSAGKCYWEPANEDPRGLGFSGILMSDMFGFRSDLDKDTLALLDKQADLVQKEALSEEERDELSQLTEEIDKLGFQTANSDPYYSAFLRAIAQRPKVARAVREGQIDSDMEAEIGALVAELSAEFNAE